MRTIGMSDYTVGEDCFTEVPAALAEYGATKVAIIGGKRALAAALPGIEAALEDTDVEVLETRVYGTNSTRANIAKVVNSPACQEADVLIACGGGKALDTVKTAAIELKKIVFTVPTICSNCSAATAIAVVYNDDGSLEGYSYPNRPAHIFINPKIIAESPAEYFWAGVGDALSKQPEVEYATSAGNLEHTAGLGLALAHTCSEPLFTYGVQGLEDVRQDLSTEAVKQIALDIVVNTGYVSNLTNQNDYYYNSSVAHVFYNATCSIPREGTYLHGEVVSLGVLVLFAYTGDTENLERYAAFNKQMGLPVTLEQVGLTEADIPALCEYAHATNEWKQGNPEPFTDEKFAEKAESFMLWKTTEGKYFTAEEYKEVVKGNQTDKNGTVVFLYVDDPVEKNSFLESAKAKGYDVLVMDGQLDNHYVNWYESKHKDARFVRVDSDVIDKLIQKDETLKMSLSEAQQEIMRPVFESQMPKDEKIHYNISFEAMAADAAPVVITQNEFMRRMKEMAAISGGGMSQFYSQMPDNFTIAVNGNNPIVIDILADVEKSYGDKLKTITKKIDAAVAEERRFDEVVKGKKEEELTPEEKSTREELSKKIVTLRDERDTRLREIGGENKLVKQIIDLALLSNGLLKGKNLTEFIQRSISLIEK